MTITSTRRIVTNAGSILTSEVVNRATTFLLYALVARHLSPFAFGQMSLALTLYYTSHVFAVAGLRTLVTREVARDKKKTEQYLVTGSMVVAVCSLLSIILLFLFVRLMSYSTETASIIMLLSLGTLPYSLSAICEAVFRAWERMHYIVYANVPANIAKVGLAALLLLSGYGLYVLMIVLVATRVAIVVLEWWVIIQHISRPRARIDAVFAVEMIKNAVTFLGIDGSIAVWSSLNIVLLSKLASETEVGFYNAAIQMLIPVMLVFQSIGMSVFPIMCRKFDAGIGRVKRVSEYLVEFLLAIAVPTTIGFFFLADSALLVLYGDKEFLVASEALRIMVWNVILVAMTQGLGRVLLASVREKVTLHIVTINLLVNLVMGLVLISRFGVLGAAMTSLITTIVDFFQHYVRVSKQVCEIALSSLMWKPVAAGTCMALYLAVVGYQGVLLAVVSASVLYAGVFLALAIWSVGGPSQLRDRYLYLWSE